MISHAHLPFTLSRVFVHAFLLSPTYGCCCCYSKSLEFLVSLWLREAQRWWSWKLTRQLFLWFRSLFENEGLPEPVGRIAKTSWPRRTRFKQIFCSSRKDSTYRKCSIALFIVASESEWSDNQMFVSLPPYPIPHQCHQCSSVNRITLRMFIRVLSLSPPPPPGLVPPIFPVYNKLFKSLPYCLNAWNRLMDGQRNFQGEGVLNGWNFQRDGGKAAA